MTRVLVAGVGNVFLGDDGFGVAVADRLADEPLPEGVRVVDYGVRGVHLAYELLDGYDALVLVDAVPMGEVPGTVALLRPEEVGEAPLVDAHGMGPDAVLATVARLGGRIPQVFVVGCQPAEVGEGMGLSVPVAEAVPGAARLCCRLVEDLVVTGRE